MSNEHDDDRRKIPANADDLLAAIEEADDDAEAARILALSDEALDAELASDGFDPEDVRRRSETIGQEARRKVEALEGKPRAGDAPPPVNDAALPPPLRLQPRRRTAVRWVLLAAAAIGALGLAAALLLRDDPHDYPVAHPPPFDARPSAPENPPQVPREPDAGDRDGR